METLTEKWRDKVGEVIIGATAQEGGTRKKTVKIGGETGISFAKGTNIMPNPPVIAMEVWDIKPQDWPDALKEGLGEVIADPVDWAKKCEQDFGADLICLKLISTHPDYLNTSPQEAGKTLEKVLKAVTVPLIVIGGGFVEKDNEVVIRCSEVAMAENCLMGIAKQDNYKTMTAACLSGRHCIIAESPIDVNISKQLNILICDMQFPANKIVIHHATGALGYGLEYTYSIMERTRLAALSGDKMLSMPMINFIGQEVWRTKEAKSGSEFNERWGDAKDRGVLWELTTAVSYINAGSDILVMWHPKAVSEAKKVIKDLCVENLCL